MQIFTTTRIDKDFRVRNSDYIRTENNPKEGADKAAAPVNPDHTEAD